MINKISTLVLLALSMILLSGCFASLAPKELRANIDGTITTDPMLKMKPVYERGVNKLGVVFVPDKKVGASHVGLTAFTNKKYLLDIDTADLDSYVANEFVNRINNGNRISAEDLSEHGSEIEGKIKQDGWSGLYYLDVTRDGVDEKIRQSGYKTLLYIKEIEFPDYIGATNQTVYSKGIYSRFDKLYAHAGFLVALIDLSAGKQMKHGAYRQASSIQVEGISWKDSSGEYSKDERNKIMQAVMDRMDVNIGESLNMLKVVPVQINPG